MNLLGQFLGVFWLNAWIVSVPLLATAFLVRWLVRGIHPRVLHALTAAMPFVVIFVAARMSITIPQGGAAIPVSYDAGTVNPPYVAIVWLAVAGMLMVREAGGGFRLARARRQWVRAGNDIWIGPAGAPMTAGLLRPVVFVPERVLRELSADAVNAIILHERDHVRFRDPLVNAVVRIIRIVFWPVVPLIGFERLAVALAEESADRAALRAAAPVAYAQSLVTVAEWSPAAAANSMAFTAGSLEDRVRRILAPGRLTLIRVFAAALIIVSAAAALDALPVAAASSSTPPAVAPVPSSPMARVVDNVAEQIGQNVRSSVRARAATRRRPAEEMLPLRSSPVPGEALTPASPPPPPASEPIAIVQRIEPPPEVIRNVIRIRN